MFGDKTILSLFMFPYHIFSFLYTKNTFQQNFIIAFFCNTMLYHKLFVYFNQKKFVLTFWSQNYFNKIEL